MAWYRKAAVQKRLQIDFYGKPGCCLCDEAKERLFRVAGRRSYDFHEYDITLDPELWEKFKWEIPVVVIGTVVLKGRIQVSELRKALRLANNRP